LPAARRGSIFRLHSERACARPKANVISEGLALTPAPFSSGNLRGAGGPPSSTRGDTMAQIEIGEGDSVERALKLFRRKLQKEGLFGELRRRRHYLKPSAARVIKAAAARRRKRKKREFPRD
jgi:small subunit ribosomal protein S21